MKKYRWIFFLCFCFVGIIFLAAFHPKPKQNYVAEKTAIKEEKISDFSTKLPQDTKERYSNIKLACKTLNGTLIKAGEVFSLWKILGCPTPEKGYQKAKTFAPGGKIKQSYGGGLCQVSTTIYNAVMEAEGLEVIERHEHSRDVVYIQDGKDAAVSYPHGDFRFRNTLNYDVRLEAKLEENKVKICLIRI